MNGRALNDRAIEVSPSSSRVSLSTKTSSGVVHTDSNKVLDRAAGSQPMGGPPLLTPFPPSKNRPRPGDWTCPSCGFSNFQRRKFKGSYSIAIDGLRSDFCRIGTACFRCSFPAMSAAQDPYSQGYGKSSHFVHFGVSPSASYCTIPSSWP